MMRAPDFAVAREYVSAMVLGEMSSRKQIQAIQSMDSLGRGIKHLIRLLGLLSVGRYGQTTYLTSEALDAYDNVAGTLCLFKHQKLLYILTPESLHRITFGYV
ncbi:MAG: hypothetical protein ACOYXT_08745 [Bacteroidota bacterium]